MWCPWTCEFQFSDMLCVCMSAVSNSIIKKEENKTTLTTMQQQDSAAISEGTFLLRRGSATQEGTFVLLSTQSTSVAV